MAGHHKPLSRARLIAASSAGTAFEWYDFFIFGTLTAIISKVFFAGLDPTGATIAALGLFAAGFAFRPIGALLFGGIGDKLGRKGAFLATVILMGGATFAIGLLPTYAQAGNIAPFLLIFLRIIQGLALGGEYGGAAIYVAEHAPANRRGYMTGWIQSSAAFGLLAALLVILITRTAVGEEAFLTWGWRIPFLVSVILLAASVWLRARMSESPVFLKMQEEGEVAKAPLREAFGTRENLKKVLLAFFAIMCAQGAVWYTVFFYIQVFLEKSLGVAGATVNWLVIVMTLVSAPLYIAFAALSDRIGRKPVLVGAMLLALVAYWPAFHAIARAVNPELVAAQKRTPVFVLTDPATCSVQFDPFGIAQFATPCDIAKSQLASAGISYTVQPSRMDGTIVMVGGDGLTMPDGRGLDPETLKTLKAGTGDQIRKMLQQAGYPAKADVHAVNYPVVLFWLFVLVIAATALYGPIAATLVEIFPGRVRYTAMSLPYHVGTGWVGGFLPVTSFALVAITGDPYASLWYPIAFTALSLVCALLFLKETNGKPLE